MLASTKWDHKVLILSNNHSSNLKDTEIYWPDQLSAWPIIGADSQHFSRLSILVFFVSDCRQNERF